MAVVNPRRHQVVPGALGGRLREHRGLDVDEAVGVQVGADRPGDLGAHQQAALHLGPAEIDVAKAQPRLLLHVLLVELQRRRVGGVEDLELTGQDLHLARRHVRVHGALGARAHPPGDPQDVLAAHALGGLEGLQGVRVDDDLHDAAAVAQVDEDDPAVVAAAVDPAAQDHVLADLLRGHVTAVVGSHRSIPREKRPC